MSALSEWGRTVWRYWRAVVFGAVLDALALLQYAVDVGYLPPLASGPVRVPPLALVFASLVLFLIASFLAFRDARDERDALLNPNPRQFDVALTGYWVSAQEVEAEARRSLRGERMPSYALILRDCEIVNRSPHPVCLSFSL